MYYNNYDGTTALSIFRIVGALDPTMQIYIVHYCGIIMKFLNFILLIHLISIDYTLI